MPTDERMTIDERHKYIRQMRKRYQKGDRSQRSLLLTEMEAVTGLHRKSIIRLLGEVQLARQPRQKQRGRTYGAQIDDAIRVIAESLDHVCAERLKPNLPWMAQHLAAHGELTVCPALLDQLTTISVSTVRRILQRLQQDQPRLPRPGPQQAQRITRDIPMKRIPWNEAEPGHFEVDLVHHSGSMASGEYVHTLQMIDVATGWSERVAVLGRSYTVLKDAFGRIHDRLPFAIREVHSDNGSEFLNYHLIRFWRDVVRNVKLSRSRPYRKNDNRFVEQKNATLVRAFLGTIRLDSVVQTRALNRLYDDMWLYYNLFQPVMRLTEKEVCPGQDGVTRYRRRFDEARTPFDRLADTQALSPEARDQLIALRAHINPRQLRKQIQDQLTHLFALPGAVAGQTEDVYQTLSTPLDLKERGRHRGNIIIWLDSLAR
jgi:transposase InsO family protein